MSATLKTVVGAGLVLAALLAVFVSPWASSRPDGLEWTLEQVAPAGEASETDAPPLSAPLPDYTVPGVEREGTSTALAGLIGTGVAFAATYALTRFAAARRRRLAHGRGAAQ